jgi:hypothetical protein
MAPKGETKIQGKEPVNIGLLGLLVLVPLLLLAAGISIPYSLAAGQIRLRRQIAFQAKLKARNRTMEWSDFVDALNEHRGTVIEERFSLKSFDRSWWTPDNLYAESLYPIADWLTMRDDPNFDQFSKWCHQRYTSPETGNALLVCSPDAPGKEVYEFWSRFRSGNNIWVEVVPLDVLPRRRRP